MMHNNHSKLRMNGENAATFLIFQAFASSNNAMRDVFLQNL